MKTKFIIPDWPVKSSIKALSTTRQGGVSRHQYSSFNTANHVDDEPGNVARNRETLIQDGNLPTEPFWLQQVHGTEIANASTDKQKHHEEPVADGSVCDKPNIVCVVQTADCLPLLFTNKQASKVGALHAGWRGLTSGIIETGIKAMGEDPDQLIFWMGPAIGPKHFEVGEDVLQAFEQRYAGARKVFTGTGNKKWHMNIYEGARSVLLSSGVKQVYGGDYCTFSDEELFYSYRRDGVCGRMASMIWIDI